MKGEPKLPRVYHNPLASPPRGGAPEGGGEIPKAMEKGIPQVSVKRQKELRWQARDLLDQLNISDRIVYPRLDGLSKWLARHYYVK